MSAHKLQIVAAQAFERDTPFRMPFRFGVMTLRAAPQAFMSVQVRDQATGREAVGQSAELMVPKWFDKRPELSPDDTVDQLRRSVTSAVKLSLDQPALTAVEHAWQLDARQAGALPDENGLVRGFGPALMAKAMLDALGQLQTLSFHDVVRSNAMGLTADHLPPDLDGLDMAHFLAQLQPQASISFRHTVGLLDPLTEQDLEQPLNDGLPESLDQVIRTYAPQYFKIKVSGDMDADIRRLVAIADVLQMMPGYRITLDGNEQYSSPEEFTRLLDELDRRPELARLREAILFIEQPIHRDRALQQPLGALAQRVPLLIDESDADLDSFLRGRDCGYLGVSSKACKGLYRSLLNKARTLHWRGGDYFMSAEDLTTQAGLGVQQDLALASLLGLTHVERNGHHFVQGMQGAGAQEMDAFARQHPGLYRRDEHGLFLRIEGGTLDLSSLDKPGFASGVALDRCSLRPLT
ncbi:mandelate racemase [Natronospirillum operosum]|uniref:Mandelate racemase n=1 Tax=Natronospirillum operosum TaxID=2759953 RepID=A0A4Z0WB37_9GAMM|nr:enolase C-terminal domain-like protein [Natronospirillum operosum]TGG93575.1 mandelate racemase [Natronospirillum operosum]